MPTPANTPFLIEHHQLDQTLSGSFRPAARMILLPALRTSGLWASLAPEDFKNLILLLTYMSPNGHCQPSVSDLAEAMHVPSAKVRSRMLRLVQFEWRGRSLVLELPRPEGVDAYALGQQLFTNEQINPPRALEPVQQGAGREAVIEYSRTHYAKTRAEVEQDIAERMGWTPPVFEGDDPAVSEGKRQAYGQMTNLGISREQALDLLERFEVARIERQLTWLPARHAKSPARFLVAAIEGDYEMPPALRRQAIMAEMAQPLEHNSGSDIEVPDSVSQPKDGTATAASALDEDVPLQNISVQDATTIYES